nr:HD domain-containing phosphohydrolase [Martelella sp. HB161492]
MTADEQQSLNLAAWLHDCGKVTTPEYVIDKSTKLETIYNRIHEIRTRFEVAKREAEAHCWRDIAEQGLAGAGRQARLDRLAQQWAELDADFAFVAACNTGAEPIQPETIARLNSIAGKSFTRTLSDRLGLSWEEEARLARTDAPALPVAEPLLADSPNHVIERQERDKIAPDNPWGFTINVPTVLYNRGEIYNLSIRRGTLTDEEFYKIKEHAVSTIRMLDKIPFPAHLNGIRYLAGAHHERMDGNGYPCSLDARELSIPARMIAVADVFEALTAADRPYRRAMPLSRALSIMASMRAEGHIDGDIFALFLTSGACLSYARANMKPEQIDAVEIADYL